MSSLIPAYIMIPEEGTTVLCSGVDGMNRQFLAVPGRRFNGRWMLDNNLPFQEITHWAPVTDELPAVTRKHDHPHMSRPVAWIRH